MVLPWVFSSFMNRNPNYVFDKRKHSLRSVTRAFHFFILFAHFAKHRWRKMMLSLISLSIALQINREQTHSLENTGSQLKSTEYFMQAQILHDKKDVILVSGAFFPMYFKFIWSHFLKT